jgi:hypothetical protein
MEPYGAPRRAFPVQDELFFVERAVGVEAFMEPSGRQPFWMRPEIAEKASTHPQAQGSTRSSSELL